MWTRLVAIIAIVLALAPARAGTFILPGPFFFVSNGGSDSNNGLSSGTAWQTIAHVNAQTFGPNAVIQFNGGQTFSGSLFISPPTPGAPGPIIVTSYGAGQATISSGNSAECVKVQNVPNVTITNIICTGGGNTTNTTDGIQVRNTVTDKQMAGPTITNNTVSGYGGNGIIVQGFSGKAGWNNVNISSNTVHDVTGNGGVVTSCISVQGQNVLGGSSENTNVTISHNLVYNCTGEAAQSNWSGSGIFVGQSSGVVMQFNVAHDFGINSVTCGGPVGIWAYFSNNVTIQFNEAYNGKQGAGACDGGGFDFDGGTTNSVMQYNYSHDNAGPGYLLYSYSDSNFPAWKNNVARFNVSQNDGGGVFVTADAALSGCFAYNNTIYSSNGQAPFANDNSVNPTCLIANNIFYATTGNVLIATHTPGLTFVSNDYFGGGTFSWNGTGYATLALWQAASGQDSSGLAVNPSLTSAGAGGTCYSSGIPGAPQPCPSAYGLLSASPMAGAGIDLSKKYQINTGARDYFGVALASPYSIGAAFQAFVVGTCAGQIDLTGGCVQPMLRGIP